MFEGSRLSPVVALKTRYCSRTAPGPRRAPDQLTTAELQGRSRGRTLAQRKHL